MTKLVRAAILLALSIFARGPAAAAGEKTWQIYEGVCNEWQGHWLVTETSKGQWTGKVVQTQVGGSCDLARARTNSTKTATITIQIDGDDFHADQANASDDNPCTYAGEVQSDDVIRGHYSCAKARGPFNFEVTR